MQSPPRKECSPKTLKICSIIVKIIAVPLFFMSLLLCFAVPIVGIIGCLFAVILFFAAGKPVKNIQCDPHTDSSKNIISTSSKIEFSKPYNINVVGVMYKHDGIDPQKIIPILNERDEIVLEWDKANQYDSTAIKVKSLSGAQLGWIPKDDTAKSVVLNELKNDRPVIAYIARKYSLSAYPGNIGFSIDVLLSANVQTFSNAHQQSKKTKATKATSIEAPASTRGFPPVDKNGRRALKLREADVYGVGKTFNGNSAQDVISELKIGDEITFEVSKNYAVKVLTIDGKQFGYLPEWDDLNAPKVKAEVYSKLSQGATVLAKVKKIYRNKNGKLGVIIDICRYAVK